MTRILLVDDQSLVRMGFRLVLESAPDLEVVGEAADGRTAVDQVVALRPDVVLMDVRMPGVDGIEATRRIVAEHPAVRVLILTTFDVDEHAFAALRAGASGFLLKDATPAELRLAGLPVRASGLADPRLAEASSAGVASLSRNPLAPAATGVHPRLAALTPRETEVLRRVAEGRSNAEIAGDLFLAEATVKTHVGRILAKLAVRDRVQAVVLAYETGLVRAGTE
jgi:DNA-binding NarL/FixJ family response regulator